MSHQVLPEERTHSAASKWSTTGLIVDARTAWIVAGLLWIALSSPGCASGPTNHYNQGVEYHQSGRLEDAVHEYKRATQLTPLDPRPRFNLAVLYQDQGKTEEAARVYREILNSHPAYAPAWANLATIHEKQGSLLEAEEAYRRALEADPNDPQVASQVGFFLLQIGRASCRERV